MKYVAFLRGINVGGNNKVDMKGLKSVFEDAKMRNVATYINSGNVIFEYEDMSVLQIAKILSVFVNNAFGLNLDILVLPIAKFKNIASNLPDEWANNEQQKCDILFLWDTINSPQIVEQLKPRADIDNVFYVDGAVIWSVDRKNIGRSSLLKIVGTDIYKQITIRNCNTVRKLANKL